MFLIQNLALSIATLQIPQEKYRIAHLKVMLT